MYNTKTIILMCTQQRYDEGANHAQINAQTVNTDQPQPLTAEQIVDGVDQVLVLIDARQYDKAEALSKELKLAADQLVKLPKRPPVQPQQAPQGDEWNGSYLQDYLQDSESRQNARLMVRAWFLSHVLQDEMGSVTNPCGKGMNVYLFELLDDFLSQPVAGKEVASE